MKEREWYELKYNERGNLSKSHNLLLILNAASYIQLFTNNYMFRNVN